MAIIDPLSFIVLSGAVGLGVSATAWALRISDGERGIVRRSRERITALEERLARADSVFSAHPGVILVWEDEPTREDKSPWGEPRVHGGPMALAAMLRFGESSGRNDAAARILDGLADLEARDAAGEATTLRARLKDLRENGTAFSLTLIGANGRFIEADGRTAGLRAVVWLSDSTIKGLDDGGARGRLEEARQVVARDPAAFLDMLGRAPFPAWRISGVSKLQWANSAYLKAVEAKSLDQAINRQIQLDPQSLPQAEKVLELGQEVIDERHVAIGGDLRALRIVMFPLSGGVGAMAFDFTEEENIRKERDRHARAHDQTLDHVTDGVAIFGPDKRLKFFNKAFSSIWELDPVWLSSCPSHGEWLDHLREHRKLPTRPDYAGWRARELAHYQEIAETPDEDWTMQGGRTIRVGRQRHPEGGLLLLFRDMTQELSLRTRFNSLIDVQRATLDKLHDAVAVFGSDGRLQLSNAAFQKMWELSPEFLIAKPDFDAVTDECRKFFHDQAVWSVIKGRVTNPSPEARSEFKGVMPLPKDKRILSYLTQPLPNGATLIAFADITDSRRVEAALHDRAEAFAAADRLKTEFIKNVSYQLRNPLSAMTGYAELLQAQYSGPLNEKQSEYVGAILAGGTDLAKLVQNILDLAMIDAGRLELNLSDVNLDEAVRDAIALSQTKARDTEVAIDIRIDPEAAIIRADGERVRQILFNLISNSLRFTGPTDRIVVGAESTGGSVRLWVEDTGPGLDAERQAAAFDAFESGDQKRGAGLGLALVNSFVELHGGWTRIYSEPGKGMTVECYLPAEPAALAPEPDLDYLDI